MFTLIKFIGQQLRRRAGRDFLASLSRPRSVSVSVEKSPNSFDDESKFTAATTIAICSRLGGLKNPSFNQQHDFLRLKRTTNTYTSCDSRICYSQYSAPTYLFFFFFVFGDCFASLIFFAPTKMPFSLITHILRGSTTTIRPSWHFFDSRQHQA